MIIDQDFMRQLENANIIVPDYFAVALTEAYRKFSEQIMIELTSFSYNPDSFGFSKLGLISREYAIQKYFEPRIETYVRQYLFTDFFERVLEEKGYDVITPTYYIPDDEFIDGEIFCSNKEFEQNAYFEFVIQKDRDMIGCRMTDIHAWDAERLFQLGLATKIIIIDWSNSDGVNEKEKERRTYGIRKNVDILGINEFVAKLLGPAERETYKLFIHRVISDYQDIIGISSHPKLTAPLFFEHRLEEERAVKTVAETIRSTIETKLENNLLSENNELPYGYRVIDKNSFKTQTEIKRSLGVEKETKELLAKSNVLEMFISRKLYKVLVGQSDFAKSFLTSEYLYSQYNKNDLFDYTAIVSGYLKSIEQLMSSIVFCFSKDLNGRTYRIKSNGKRDKDGNFPIDSKPKKIGSNKIIYTIPLSEENAEYVDTTIGSLIHFLDEYKQDLMTIEPVYQTAIIDSLECYRIECRNDSFHSHNNYDWKKVKAIRNNTICLYIMLLGSFRLTDQQLQEQFTIIQNDSLEHVYYWLRKKGMYSFKVKLSDGNYYFANRRAEKAFPSFDSNGLLKDGFAIELSCTEEKSNERKMYLIDRNNIPEEIWYTTFVDSYLVFRREEST